MAYGPTQRLVPSGMKQADPMDYGTTKLQCTDSFKKKFKVCLNTTMLQTSAYDTHTIRIPFLPFVSIRARANVLYERSQSSILGLVISNSNQLFFKK